MAYVRLPSETDLLFFTELRGNSTNLTIFDICRIISGCIEYKKYPVLYKDEIYRQKLVSEPVAMYQILPGLLRAIDIPTFKSSFCETIFPFIWNQALKILTLFPTNSSLPIIQTQSNDLITLSIDQATCLLANMFLCMLPQHDEKSELPGLQDFELFFTDNRETRDNEKLKMYLNFFRICSSSTLAHTPTLYFRRLFRNPITEISGSDKKLSKFQIDQDTELGIGRDKAPNMYVDFANMYIGGGLISGGTIQEEIMFASASLATISLLFFPKMWDNDAIRITGAESFSSWKGYDQSFEFDPTAERVPSTKQSTIVAIDATPFQKPEKQYERDSLLRELNKALAGFCVSDLSDECQANIIETGNWGCGQFGGDVEFKLLIQWIAATIADKKILYYPFGHNAFKDNRLEEFIRSTQDLTVGKLYEYMLSFCSLEGKEQKTQGVFEFIVKKLHP